MNNSSLAATRSLLVAALVVAAPTSAQVLKQPLKPISGLSLLPALMPPVIPAGTVHDQPITLAFQIKNLKAGTSARVTSFEPTRAGCSFRVATATPVPTVTVGSNGIASFSVRGMFSELMVNNTPLAPGFVGPCVLVAKVEATSMAGESVASTFTSAPATLAPPRIHVVTDTFSWLPKLRFSPNTSQGSCSGMSEALGQQSYRVGLIENNGTGSPPPDITFSIRSGPTGTGCTWRSQPLVLPASMRLTQVNATIQKTSKCNLSIASIPPAATLNLINVSMRGATDPLVNTAGAAMGTVVASNPQGAGLYTSFLTGFVVDLRCEKTLVNDHYVTVSLDSFTFESAQGTSLP